VGRETVARSPRGDLQPGAYHVASHGVGDRSIFLDDFDRTSFLRQLGCVVYRFRWICCAYCLMSNHYHLIVDTSAESLSDGVKVLDGVYSRRFNKRHRRKGRLFREHFMSERIDDDYRFRNALKYVARNPVDAGICAHPGEWVWSSYGATAGTTPAPEFLSVQPALSHFSQNERRARNTYIDFVSGSSPEVEREMKSRYYSSEPITTCKVRERQRPTLSELFEGCDSTESRNQAICQAYQVFGYTLAEIGGHVGLCASTISRVGRLHHRNNIS
jgi:REP element-mobilizing transposase RayT